MLNASFIPGKKCIGCGGLETLAYARFSPNKNTPASLSPVEIALTLSIDSVIHINTSQTEQLRVSSYTGHRHLWSSRLKILATQIQLYNSNLGNTHIPSLKLRNGGNKTQVEQQS